MHYQRFYIYLEPIYSNLSGVNDTVVNMPSVIAWNSKGDYGPVSTDRPDVLGRIWGQSE